MIDWHDYRDIPGHFDGVDPLRVWPAHHNRANRRIFEETLHMSGHKTEMDYKGYTIKQVPYQPASGLNDCNGMKVTHAYMVYDELDEPGLPFAQTWFWSPADAISAIDLAIYMERLKTNPRWPTTLIYEYNQALRYRWRWGHVYAALLKIQTAAENADMMGEDPTQEILQVLAEMKTEVLAT